MANEKSLNELINVVRVLRSEQGCPWDRKQTHKSLKSCMLEEAYEVIEAIDQEDRLNLQEELGDVLLQVVLHSVIAEEEGAFTIEDVCGDVTDKMIRRHPHVFGISEENSVDGIAKQWDEIKMQEHKEETIADSLLRIPKAMPATMRAAKMQKKLAKVGMNTDDVKSSLEAIENAIKTLCNTLENKGKVDLEEQYGQLLFQVVNLSTILDLNAENSLTNAVDKFINRLVGIERIANREGKRLSELSINYENELWKLGKNKQ